MFLQSPPPTTFNCQAQPLRNPLLGLRPPEDANRRHERAGEVYHEQYAKVDRGLEVRGGLDEVYRAEGQDQGQARQPREPWLVEVDVPVERDQPADTGYPEQGVHPLVGSSRGRSAAHYIALRRPRCESLDVLLPPLAHPFTIELDQEVVSDAEHGHVE